MVLYGYYDHYGLLWFAVVAMVTAAVFVLLQMWQLYSFAM